MDSKTLIEEISPNGNVQAFVEQDNRVAHFYLWGGPDSEFGTRTCWVRNLKPGYKDQNQMVIDMRGGTSPLLDRDSCKHPDGAAPLDGDRLRIVWFEEGDAAALLEGDEILAVIPGWSGQGEFCGYARDCMNITPICWPLAEALENMQGRISLAEAFWASWDDETDPWSKMKNAFMSTYESLGEHTNYYAIDGGDWPPKAMLRIPIKDGIALVTLGVSLRPQPRIECAFDEPSPNRRFELGVCLGPFFTNEKDVMQMARYVSAQTNLPWSNFTWIGDGHTIPCDSIPGGGKNGFTSVLLLPFPPGAPETPMPSYRGDPIRMLWLIPITEAERSFAIEHGSALLVDRLREIGCTWEYRPRRSAI